MSCKFCQIIEDNPRWCVWHGEDVISIKPFGGKKGQRMFIPVQHLDGADKVPAVTARCFEEAARWAADKGKPFKLSVNSGREAGQVVFHMHIHYIPFEKEQQ